MRSLSQTLQVLPCRTDSSSGGPDCRRPRHRCQAVVAGTHCYVSGQLAVDETGTFRPGSAREEAALAFENVFGALAAAGFGRHEIAFVDVAFIDLGDVPAMNTLWAELFRRTGARHGPSITQRLCRTEVA